MNSNEETPESQKPKERWIDLCSDNLAYLGIHNGDKLYVRVTETFDENKLSVWSIPSEKHLAVGFAYENFGDISIQRNNEILRYPKRKIKLIGTVESFARHLNFDAISEPEPEKEITVICAECSTKLKGTSDFIKGMGWKLGSKSGRKTLCLNCDLF